MSLPALTWAFKAPLTVVSEKFVLVALADHADLSDGFSWPSQGAIAAKTALSVRSIHNALKSLQAAGLIVAGKKDGRSGFFLQVDNTAKVDEPATIAGQPATIAEAGIPAPATIADEPAIASTEPATIAAPSEPSLTVINPDVDAAVSVLAEIRLAWPDIETRLEWPGLSNSTGMLSGWLREGADLQRDILPAIRAVSGRMAKSGRDPPSNLSYFRRPVADAKANNERGLPDGQPAPARPFRPSQHPSQQIRNGFAEMALSRIYGQAGNAEPGMGMDIPDPDHPAPARDRRRLA